MKARNKALLAIGITMALATTSISFAQLPNLSKLGAGSSSSSSATAPDSSISEDQLVQAYVAADYETLVGDSKIAEALGLDKEAAALAAAAQALNSGGPQDGSSMGKADKVLEAAKPVIEAALKKTANLIGQAKVTYGEGLVHLGRGVQGTVKLKAAAIAFGQEAQAQIKAASMVQKMGVIKKLAAGTYVATNIVGHIANVLGGLKLAVAFAQSHGISIPADAAAALTPV
jgi:hypothetical protein